MKYKVATWIQPFIDYFWSNKANILEDEDFYFDYPDYGGLPEDISSQLDSDIVDRIQLSLVENLRNSRTRTAFAKVMVTDLSGGTVIVTS